MRSHAAVDWMYGTPEPRRHMQAAFVALALSIALHVVALMRLPPLAFLEIQPDRVATPSTEPRPLRVEDVRTAPHEIPDDAAPPVLTAERLHEVFRPIPPGVDARPDAPPLEAFAPPEPELPGRRTALASPGPLPAPQPREARMEHIEITREIVAERDAARPRRVAPRIDRATQAPDITLPADPALLTSDDPDPASWMDVSREGVGALRPGPRGMPGLDPDQRRSGLPGDATREMFRDVDPQRDVKPVDRYLAFDLQVHRPADEPDRLYFRLEIRRHGDESLPVLPRDLLLIQDCSESMTQALLDRCKDGLRAFIQTLGPEDRFDIVAFRETQRHSFGEWTPATPANRTRAQWFVEQLEAMGRTDVMASLETILSKPVSPGRPAIAVIITDGVPTSGVLDQSAILERFTRENAGDVSVFPFGGGAQVNRFLLDFLGFKNRGEAAFAESLPTVPAGLQRLAQSIRRPVLAGLTYRVTGLQTEDVYPQTLTNLYLDRPLVIYGRAPRDAAPAVLYIEGLAGARRHDIMQQLDWAAAAVGGAGIREAWAMQKAYHLIGEHATTGNPAVMERLRNHSRRTGIRTPYADALR